MKKEKIYFLVDLKETILMAARKGGVKREIFYIKVENCPELEAEERLTRYLLFRIVLIRHVFGMLPADRSGRRGFLRKTETSAEKFSLRRIKQRSHMVSHVALWGYSDTSILSDGITLR